MSVRPLVLAIVGPTASGKSSLAEEVATRLSASVVSTDAMQVYRGMDIGTAKTPVGERRCPLLMVDVCPVGEDYSVRLFQRDARAAVDSLLAKGEVPVLCGGTGLYLDAVIDQMDFPSGERGSEARERYERLAESEGGDAVWRELERRDPESANLIHPHNVRRVIRALELLDQGDSYAKTHEGLHSRASHFDALIFGLQMKRQRLYRRIEERVDGMFDAGLVDEVMTLRGEGLERSTTASQAIGYKEVLELLDGRATEAEARDLVKMRTRRYAKRQISWFRRDGRVRWLDMDALDTKGAADVVLKGLSDALLERGSCGE